MEIAFLTANIRSCFNKVKKYYHFHSSMISAYAGIVFNTNLLAHKIFTAFPSKIAHFSRSGLSFMGIISINGRITDLKKSYDDLIIFSRSRKKIGMLLTSIKVVYKAVDILLEVGGGVVSVAALCGRTHWIDLFYTAVRVEAMCSLTLSAVSMVSDYVINGKLRSNTMPDRELWVSAQFDRWDQQRLKDEAVLTSERLIELKLESAEKGAWMSVVGYVLLGTRILKPESTLNAFVMWVNSIAWGYLLHKSKFGT